MFGLEEEKKKPTVEFDLEIELKDKAKFESYNKLANERIQELKSALRTGGASKEVDEYTTLLKGYTALEKMLKKITKFGRK